MFVNDFVVSWSFDKEKEPYFYVMFTFEYILPFKCFQQWYENYKRHNVLLVCMCFAVWNSQNNNLLVIYDDNFNWSSYN